MAVNVIVCLLPLVLVLTKNLCQHQEDQEDQRHQAAANFQDWDLSLEEPLLHPTPMTTTTATDRCIDQKATILLL
jgi:hypothetical protein